MTAVKPSAREPVVTGSAAFGRNPDGLSEIESKAVEKDSPLTPEAVITRDVDGCDENYALTVLPVTTGVTARISPSAVSPPRTNSMTAPPVRWYFQWRTTGLSGDAISATVTPPPMKASDASAGQAVVILGISLLSSGGGRGQLLPRPLPSPASPSMS